MGKPEYIFKPKKFYLITLAVTWVFWFAAAFLSKKVGNTIVVAMVLMALGLCVPSVTAFIFVKRSNCDRLKQDYKEKLCCLFRINVKNLLAATTVMIAIIFTSIGISLLFGESKDQFAFADGFSFSIGGMPTLLLLLITGIMEELGWRGYAEDSIAQYHTWFTESIIFGFLWAGWHIPLFFIEGTYQANILAMNPLYMINFFVSMMPIGFIITWVYVKNNRSIFACSIFHFIINFLQEQIAMTQNTKCIETIIVFIAAAIIVACNKDMFFEKRHIGNILGE